MSETSRIYIAGKTPEGAARHAVERDAKKPGRGRKIEPWLMNAYQRRSELQELARYRIRNGFAIGSEASWAEAIANVCRVIHAQVNAQMVHDVWAACGGVPLPSHIVDEAVKHWSGKAWGKPVLFTAAYTGSILYLSAAEREEAGIEKIQACDEDDRERTRRKDRERKALQRAAKAALAPKPETKKEMAARLGISRMQLDRWIKAGKV